jgi:hypothetical protein
VSVWNYLRRSETGTWITMAIKLGIYCVWYDMYTATGLHPLHSSSAMHIFEKMVLELAFNDTSEGSSVVTTMIKC